MDKTSVKNFAIWARKKLIGDISYKANLLGITPEGIRAALPQSTREIEFYDIGLQEPFAISGREIEQRRHLAELIQQKKRDSDYQTAYNSVIEEVAYTWFNRLIAVRFMEVNDYLPSHTRILSSDSKNKLEPDIVTHPFDTELSFTEKEKEQIIQWQHENAMDSLFMLLFIKACNALNELLPKLFEKTSDYTELLLNLTVTDRDGVVYRLVHDIPEEDFDVEQGGQVEIIGWIYQYYNEDLKNTIIDINNSAISKEEIPAATQLFTTDWVVRYIVDNSLGRFWLERNPTSDLKYKLDFYVEPIKQSLNVIDEKVRPEELTVFDPCMGSGHFLVYAFDVLMLIYKECGYSEREAAKSIVENNLFGLDIDDRAFQLAYFAVLMKARRYNRRILDNVTCNLKAISESNYIDESVLDYIKTAVNGDNFKVIEYLLDKFKDAKIYGSMIKLKDYDYQRLFSTWKSELCSEFGQSIILWKEYIEKSILPIIENAIILTNKYKVVVTNPPYLNKYNQKLKLFLNENYKNYLSDLFSVFVFRNFDFCEKGGYSGFMTPFVWMFIKSYESLRDYILNNKSIVTLIRFEYSAFTEATVPICSFVLKNNSNLDLGCYFNLSRFVGGMDVQKEKFLECLSTRESGIYYETLSNSFKKLPGHNISFWASANLANSFELGKQLREYSSIKKGMDTGSNDKFLRFWAEVNFENICFGAKSEDEFDRTNKRWVPLQKGGSFRKWYGNNSVLINWFNNGYDLRISGRATLRGQQYYFKEGISWSTISSSYLGMRYVPNGFIFETAGNMMFFNKNENVYYFLGFLCSKLPPVFMECLNPTITRTVGSISNLPIIYSKSSEKRIIELSQECVNITKNDWDAFETSWNFQLHPLVPQSLERKEQLAAGMNREERWKSVSLLTNRFVHWERECTNRFSKLKQNEEELNRIFIDIYGLQDELTPEVTDKDITIRKADLQRDIRSLISYAVGCMFGRFSLDHRGLVYAGGEWDYDSYTTFKPDEDNVIPITDEEYFDDDIVGVFCKWLEAVYGKETLEENLDFIAKALGNSGNTSREIIRNYFLKDFYKDHCKIYQKRPIYWLFDSGKQNGFKALIYLHRYDRDTIGNMRAEYLHRMEHVYESEINRMNALAEQSQVQREVANARKRAEKLQKQLRECKEYDEKVGHLAVDRIALYLDDGVKVNYEKVQTDRNGNKYQILAKIG